MSIEEAIKRQAANHKRMTRTPAGLQAKKKPRTNWKKELRAERDRVLNEAIVSLRDEMRSVPPEWHRGYNSAITKLELMMDRNRS